MATTSFNKQKETTLEVTSEIVPAASAPLVPAKSFDECGVEGEITTADLKFPRLNLVQKIGNLSNDFDAGCIVFDKAIVLSTKAQALDLTVLRLKKQYQEVLPYGSEDHPRVFNTMAEVREAGGTTERGTNGILFAEMATIQVAIKRPEGCPEDQEALFCEEFNGEQYALGLWTLAKTAYTSAGKTLITKAMNQLKSAGILSGQWSVTVELRNSDKYSWFVPIFKLVGTHTPETQSFFRSLLSR